MPGIGEPNPMVDIDGEARISESGPPDAVRDKGFEAEYDDPRRRSMPLSPPLAEESIPPVEGL